MNQTDEQLVERSQAGDRSAFEELVRRTARLVFARLYLQTGDAHRAEDLAQETFLLAWRNIRQVNDRAGFRTWLMTISRTVLVDAGRREGRKKRGGMRITSSEMDEVTDRSHSPDESAQRDEARERVRDVLNGLPEEYRLPITLRYIAGADYESIGQQLGLTNGSLRGLLSRGMAKLRAALKEE